MREVIEMTVDTPHLAYLARVACGDARLGRDDLARRRRASPSSTPPGHAADAGRSAAALLDAAGRTGPGWWRRRRADYRGARPDRPTVPSPSPEAPSSVMSLVTSRRRVRRRRASLLFVLVAAVAAAGRRLQPGQHADGLRRRHPEQLHRRLHGQHQRRRRTGNTRTPATSPPPRWPRRRMRVRLRLDRAERPLQRRQQEHADHDRRHRQPGLHQLHAARPSRASTTTWPTTPTACPETSRRPGRARATTRAGPSRRPRRRTVGRAHDRPQ